MSITTVYKDVFRPKDFHLSNCDCGRTGSSFFSCSAAGLHEKIDPSKTDGTNLHVAYMNLEIASRL